MLASEGTCSRASSETPQKDNNTQDSTSLRKGKLNMVSHQSPTRLHSVHTLHEKEFVMNVKHRLSREFWLLRIELHKPRLVAGREAWVPQQKCNTS